MVSTEKQLTYEEERQRIIEENKRRMKELGLLETIESFQKQSTPRKWIKRVNLELGMERRSTRAASRPKVDYREVRRLKIDYKEAGMELGLRRSTGGGRRLVKKRAYISPAAKSEAAVRAGNIKTTHPSFVKAMLKSHTSGGFWLGLPTDFCKINFCKDDIVILEDEEGLEWECVYLHHKHGLSGGWRGFSLDHELEDGDATVFELVTPSRFKVFIIRAAVSEDPSTPKTPVVAKKRNYHYVVKDSKNVHVHSALHKTLKRERGDEFEGRVSRQYKFSKQGKKYLRRDRYDWSSDESEEADDVEDTSEDESEATDESGEDSDEEEAVQSSEDEAEQSADGDIQAARKLKKKTSRPAKKLLRSKQKSPVMNIEDSDEEDSKLESDDDTQLAKNLKEKIPQVTKRMVKPKQQLKAKTESKSRHVTPGRKDSSKASLKVVKKETFVRRADRRTDVQEVRKEIAARQIEQKCNLPPGTRLKPVGVCSITRGSGKRKLPAIFPIRKCSFFSGPKSVKVH